MKLHKLAPTELDFSTNSVQHLSEKYLGRLGNGNQQPLQFGDAAYRKGRKGRYPPSRDGEFKTMLEKEQFEEQLAKGGHGVPLTSQSPFLPAAASRVSAAASGPPRDEEPASWDPERTALTIVLFPFADCTFLIHL